MNKNINFYFVFALYSSFLNDVRTHALTHTHIYGWLGGGWGGGEFH